MYSIVLFLSVLVCSDPVDEAVFVSLAHDTATYQKLMATIHTVQERGESEPGIKIDGWHILVSGDQRPDLFTFSVQFYNVFSSMQKRSRQGRSYKRKMLKTLHDYGVSHEDMELMEYLVGNVESVDYMIDTGVDQFRINSLVKLKLRLSKEPSPSNASRNLYVQNVLRRIDERRYIEIRDWAFAIISKFSKSSRLAIGKMIQKEVIPEAAIELHLNRINLKERANAILDDL